MINEVRDRLDRIATVMTTSRMVSSIMIADDIRALLIDHARLTEELCKVNSGETVSVRYDLSPAAKGGAIRDQPPHLCDLCRVRKAVRSDDEGIPFCQECWDGWRDNGVRVDRGALQMALNVLRRAGKGEVADALAGGVIDGQGEVK